MIGLTSLEVFKFIFKETEENNKFELHTDTFDEFSFAKLRHGTEEIPKISNTSHKHLQAKILDHL